MRHVPRTLDAPDDLVEKGQNELTAAIAHFESNPPNPDSFEFKRYKLKSVKNALEKMFHGKCAYCETFYASTQPLDVEHYRPKGAVAGVGDHRGYWWLAMAWTNLLPSCIDCNRKRNQVTPRGDTSLVRLLEDTVGFTSAATVGTGKKDSFPLADPATRAAQRTDQIGAERAMLLNPCEENPDPHLKYFFDRDNLVSFVLANELADDPVFSGDDGLSMKGATSIHVYGLNRLRLGRFIVNRIVRPRFACSGCEAFTQATLPSRPIERGRPGPGLLAHVLVNKYADHLPLYRQSNIFERDGIDIDRSTLADWVGKSTALLEPLAAAIGRHVLAGQAIFADDTPVKMLAPGTGKTATARLWAYGRDERPWGSNVAPASWYQFSPDRKGQHPKDHLAKYQGWMHADGYAGFEDLYRSGDIREVACMAHVRRKFVDVHRAQGSAIADETIKRIAQLYAVEKEARGSPPDQRADLRQAQAKPIFDDLETWLHAQLPSISGKSPLAGAIRYALTRMARLRPYLDHGILELDNNTAERAMRSVAIGRKNYLFCGSQTGGRAAAIAYTLIETAKLNGIDPQAWLADTLARIPDYKINRVDELLPWKTAS